MIFFKNVNANTTDGTFIPPVENDQGSNLDETNLNVEISYEEIEKAINKLNNSKAPSKSDNILNEYLKTTKDKLLPIYKYLFNAILENGYLSEAWLGGTIHPIYKGKGSPKDPSNYRPITILSCLGKLFTAILNNRLNLFLEDNDILMENQAGFRKDYSCSVHIFSLNCLMQALKKRKRKLFCCFIDFSQAFDKSMEEWTMI